MESTDLVNLIQKTARGDEAAFQSLYKATSPRIYSVSLKLLRRQDWAEEITQEAYVRIWYHASEYHMERGQPITWMISIMRNLAIDRLRSKKEVPLTDSSEFDDTEYELEKSGTDPQINFLQSHSALALSGCIDELSETQRNSIFLAFFEGLSHGQLTMRLDQPLGTIKSWIRRGLQSLRRCLEQ